MNGFAHCPVCYGRGVLNVLLGTERCPGCYGYVHPDEIAYLTRNANMIRGRYAMRPAT